MKTKKWASLLAIFTLLLSVLLPSTISHASMPTYHLKVGEKVPLDVVIQLTDLKKDAEGLKIKWESTNTAIAKVDYANQLIGVGKGTATIRGMLDGFSAPMVEFKAVVSSTVTGIAIEKTSMKMVVGEEYQLLAYVKPTDAFLQTIKWSTDNRNVVTVSGNGKLKAVGVGTATITAETVDGGLKATCKITVTSDVKDILVNAKEMKIHVGEKKILPIDLVKDTTYQSKLNYTMDKNDVIKISAKGEVTGLKEGVANVTITTIDGKIKRTIKVYTISNIETLYLAKSSGERLSSLNLRVGESFPLLPVGDPNNLKALQNYKVVYTTSNADVLKIDSKGKITAMGAGKATITATLPQELKPLKATLTVNVSSMVKSVKLNKTSLNLPVGGKETLIATVAPENAFLKDVTWKSENSKIATVSSKGEVKGISAGTIKVSAITKDGKKVATATVKVYSMAKGVHVSSTNVKLHMGTTSNVTVSVYPDTTLVKTIQHKITTNGGSKIASVKKNKDGSYTITGLKPGTINVEFKTKDGNYKKVITVTVLKSNVKVIVAKK